MYNDKKYLISSSVVKKAKEGDQLAFETIYETYFQRINFMVKQYILDDEEAKDITHDIFINVYQNISKLKEENAFHSWLYRMTYNTCSNYNRVKYREVVFNEEKAAEDVVDIKVKKTSDIIENQRIMNVIEESLQEMSNVLKSVGTLKYFAGLKIEEIAEILDIPKGTVKSRLNKVRILLKKDLKKHGISPRIYGFALFFPQTISIVYEQIFQQTTTGKISLSSLLAKEAVVENIGIFVAANAKVITGVFAIVTAGIFAGVSLQQEPIPVKEVIPEEPKEVVEVKEEPSISLAEIVAINYPTQWTNESIFIEVQTTNNEYDAIAIDGIITNQIDYNGIYQVQLLKDEQVIDQRELVVTNIDRDSPQAHGQQEDNRFTIYLTDDISGVDPDSIVLIRKGSKSNEYHYDSVNRILTIETKKDYSDLVYIYDYAGNELKIVFN